MSAGKKKLNILFLCTGNSCRSQMAEGWARHLLGDRIDVYSAGTSAQQLNANAVRAMADQGIDISGHHAKQVKDLADVDFDYVFTVCDNARDNCPIFPGTANVIHNPFDDPPALARKAEDDEEALSHYHRVCSEIREWVEALPQLLEIT